MTSSQALPALQATDLLNLKHIKPSLWTPRTPTTMKATISGTTTVRITSKVRQKHLTRVHQRIDG